MEIGPNVSCVMMKHSLANHLQVCVLINCVYFCWKFVYKKFPPIKVIPRLLFKHSYFLFPVEEFGGCSACGAYLKRKRWRKRKWERGSKERVKVKPVTMRFLEAILYPNNMLNLTGVHSWRVVINHFWAGANWGCKLNIAARVL